jgi:adenylate kinase
MSLPGIPGPMTRVVALTGTPGVGKTTVAALLLDPGRHAPIECVEVQDLARWFHGGKLRKGPPRAAPASVDLDQLARWVRRCRRDGRRRTLVVVGHLSHLLPVQDVFLLRASPAALERRLSGRGGTRLARQENVEAERIDLILQEALSLGRTVHEFDTTGKPPSTVANWLRHVLDGDLPPRHGGVDWLSTHPPRLPRPPRRRQGRPPPPNRQDLERSLPGGR